MADSDTKTSNSLELLPPELQYRILQNIADPKTLLSLIRASPRYLQVFRQRRNIIISQVICNYISPGVLPVALEVLARRRFRGQGLDRAEVGTFVEGFPDTLPETEGEISFETSLELLSFHNLVEEFMEEFAIERLAIITQQLHPKRGLSDDTSLTRTENIRLSRAFYHLELYGLLFSPLPSTQDVSTVTDQSAAFLKSITEGQLESLLCVRLFLVERVTIFLDQVEEDFMEDLVSLGPHPFHQNLSSRWEDSDWFFAEDMHPVLQEAWREHCLTRGLSALKPMFNAASAEARCDLVGDTSFPETTIEKALSLVDDQRKSEPWPRSHTVDDSDSWAKTLSWAWGNKYPHVSNSERGGGIRRWGYIIWDQHRLESLGVYKFSTWEVSKGCLLDLGRSHRKCVQDRAREQSEAWEKEGLLDDWKDEPKGPWHAYYLEE
ncbi:hypothetical protein LSUE1_G006288 [Lachnellula suecica]|uniref:F-box domain-containing protein n=1 Tax=Lachnellula suecica TaxID=602035 RepID=A0A8T9C619_9HELO|nr:hypothetical protein LSUE1_G006288 [Lachnellula suecica]